MKIIDNLKDKAAGIKAKVENNDRIRVCGDVRKLHRDYVPVAVEFKRDPEEAKKLRRKRALIAGATILCVGGAVYAGYNAGHAAGERDAASGGCGGSSDDAALANTYDYSGV